MVYTLLKCSPKFPKCIITLQTHKTSFSISFISRICYIGNNFTQKIDVEILLTYNQWRHVHALLLLEFLSKWSSKVAKIIQTFDAIKPEKLFKMLEIKKPSDTQTYLPKFFSIQTAGFAMKNVKSWVSLYFSVLNRFVLSHRTIEKFLWSIPSCFLINFVF